MNAPHPAARTHPNPGRGAACARRAVRLVAAALVLAVLAGCDIRDEMPRTPRPRALLGDAGQTPGGGERAIEYVGGYEAGRQRAVAEARPLVLVCTAGWCRFSTEMTQRTLRDPRLVVVSRRAVCVLLDADRDADACRTLGVRAFPTVLVQTAEGEEAARLTGRADAATLAATLEQAFEPRRLAAEPDTEPVR